MAQLDIDFTWWKDAKGYRLLETEPRKPRPTKAANTQGGSCIEIPELFRQKGLGDKYRPRRIMRIGGELTPYQPLIRFERLFEQFANIELTPDGVLNFIERFGPLTEDGLKKDLGEYVPSIIMHAETMRGVLKTYAVRGGKSVLANVAANKGIGLGTMDVGWIADPERGGLKLRLTVPDLLTGLWIQLGQQLSSGAVIQQCMQCGGLFEVGPGSGRRRDAKFCSDEHRILYNSLKRKEVA